MSADPFDAMRNRNALLSGTVLRDYVLVSAREEGVGETDELGSGGFGIVYLARHRDREHWRFAIKEFFPTELAVRDEDGSRMWPANAEAEQALTDGLSRFHREAEQLRRFRNERHVVSCVNYFEANRTAYMVMDYDDGIPLSKYLRMRESDGRPFDEADLLAVAIPLLEGLSAVHRAEVLHRDIKPGNVFVRREDDRMGHPAEPVLMDFGAAKQQYLSRHSRSNAPYTPGYAAPEQQSTAGELSPATDLYAVGAMLWRMVAGGSDHPGLMVADDREGSLSGSRAWSPEPSDALARTLRLLTGQSDPMPSAMELGAGRFSESVLRVVDRCLAIDAKDRPQDCSTLLGLLRGEEDEVALERAEVDDKAAGSGTSSDHGGEGVEVPGNLRMGWRRGPLWVGGVAAVFLVALAGAWLIDWGPKPAVPGGSAILVVNTDPPGAQVLIGDVAVGETPLERSDIRAGSHRMTLRHPYYEEEVLDQEFVDHQEVRITRELQRGVGQLKVTLDPKEAWIERDGERLAEVTPVTLEDLPAGVVELVVGAEEHHPIRVEAEVPKGGVGVLEQKLEAIPHGTLTLELEPPDATVTLLDMEPPYSPGMRVPEGSHRLVVRRNGYHEVERMVEVSGDTQIEVTLALSTQPFTMIPTPSSAQVRLLNYDGRYRAGMELPPGEYHVEVSARGYETEEVTVQHGTQPSRRRVTLALSTQPFTVIPTPSSARVRLLNYDGRYRAGMELPPGEYHVEVSARGYETEEVTVQHGTQPSRRRVTLALSRQPFTVIPTPSSARVRLLNHDGRYRAGMELPPGEYHVEVSARGYETEEVTVQHGTQPSRRRVTLALSRQPFTVIPTPSSARVRLLNHDGRYRAGMELPPGTYHIRVTATGYQTEELTIRHGDQPTRERISLQPFATHCVDPLSGNYCQLGVGVFLLRGAACSCYGYGGQTLFNGVAQ